MDPKTELITTLKELYFAIEEGAIDKVKRKVNWLHQDLERNKQLLRELHTSGYRGATQTDLIIAVCRNRQAKFRNNEAEFRNREVEFHNREVKFRKHEAEFRNLGAEFHNNEAVFRNRKAEFRNIEAEFRNIEAEFRNIEAEFRSKEAIFRENETEFRNREAEFSKKEAEFSKNESEIHNREAEFRNIEAEFRNIEAEFRNKEAEYRKNEAAFRNKEEEFRKNEAEFCNKKDEYRKNEAEFRNRQAFRNIEEELRSEEEEFRSEEEEFRNNEAEFHKNEEEFCNIEREFRNEEAEFRNKKEFSLENEAKFSNRVAEFRYIEAGFRNKEAEFRNREAEFLNRQAEFRIKEVEFRTAKADFLNRLVDILYYLLFETDILDHFPGADFNDKEVKTQRTEAFKLALILESFPMVEMLYDYWIGDLHWIGHDINKITTLGEILDAARVVCTVENQQLLLDIHSLIKFNDFQKKLYSEISKIGPEEMKTMIVTAVSIYDQYLDIEMFRLKHEDEKQDRKIKAFIEDESSDCWKMRVYIIYECYYRKLDFNVALLVLDNWFVLKKYFKNNADTYKKIERALYHFIHRTCEDWRLYLPRDRHITIEENHKGIHNGNIINNLKISYDEHKDRNAPVLFLERKSFNKHVRKLKKTLQTTEKNDLFNDYYSLRKMNYYLKAIDNTNNISVLMIKRVLQVTGEMLKSTNVSEHLSEDTKALLQIAMSVETVKYLSKIRDFLSHPEERPRENWIKNAPNQNQAYNDQVWMNVKQDLKIISLLINSVLDIYKLILDKSLLEKGERLLDERITSLPDKAGQYIGEINRRFDIHGEELLESNSLLQELIDETGLKEETIDEIIRIRSNKDGIKSVKTGIDQPIVSKLPTYIQNIRHTLKLIDENNRGVEFINQQFKNQLKDLDINELRKNPELRHINRKKAKVEGRKLKNNNAKAVLQTLKELKCFSIHWTAINNMLSFCYDECKLFGPKPQIVNDVPTVTKILDDLDGKCRPTSSCESLPTWDGTAIKTLHDSFDRKAEIMPREELITSLISRVNLLKQIIQYSQPLSLEEHLRKYRHDLKFRFELEMVLADIGNFLAASEIKGLMDKSGKLLSKIDLGNVLDHGNPFLDVISFAFDSNDVATAMLSKAMMFAEDGESIEALFELIKAKIDYETIKTEDINQMNDQQKDDYKRFKKSPNWESYADLILLESE